MKAALFLPKGKSKRKAEKMSQTPSLRISRRGGVLAFVYSFPIEMGKPVQYNERYIINKLFFKAFSQKPSLFHEDFFSFRLLPA